MDEKILIKLVSSFVLGDGGLSSLKSYYTKNPDEISPRKNSHYYLKQLSIHEDYVNYQTDILHNITPTTTVTVPAYTDTRGYPCKEQLNLSSRYHPFYTKMRERFYFEGKKQIDPHYMNLWDEQTLACFYMDNGWIDCDEQKSGNIYIRVGLATHAFSYGDVFLFKNWMKEKLDFNFDIKRHKQKSGEYKFYLQNSKDNAHRFLDRIHQYIFPSFEYKFSTERFTPYKVYVPKNKGDEIV